MRGKVRNAYNSFNKIKFYYGLVVVVNADYTIRFRIPELLDNLADEEYPIAHPILKHSSEIRVGDNVLIMQLDEDIQDFVYFSNDTSEFTGIEFGNNRIDISDGENIIIEHITKRNEETHEPEGSSSRVTISDNKIKCEVLSGTNAVSTVELDGSKINISNTTDNMKKILDDLLDALIGMTTIGSPAAHTVSPDTIAKFTLLKSMNVPSLFK